MVSKQQKLVALSSQSVKSLASDSILGSEELIAVFLAFAVGMMDVLPNFKRIWSRPTSLQTLFGKDQFTDLSFRPEHTVLNPCPEVY